MSKDGYLSVNGTLISGDSVLRSIRSIGRLPGPSGQAVWTGDRLVDRQTYEMRREIIAAYQGWYPVEATVCGWRFLAEADIYGNYISVAFTRI